MEEPIRINPTQVVEIIFQEKDLPYLYASFEKAREWFGNLGQPAPVELLDVRDNPHPGTVIVVILYDRPGDLFNLGAVQKGFKEKEILDKVVKWVDFEIKNLLTPNLN